MFFLELKEYAAHLLWKYSIDVGQGPDVQVMGSQGRHEGFLFSPTENTQLVLSIITSSYITGSIRITCRLPAASFLSILFSVMLLKHYD